MAEKPAEKVGKYTLERRIAAGGMAEVFLASDASGRQCVIKRMLPNLQIDKQFAQMFLDEAKLVVQLNHPSIAQIYDFGQDKGVLYLAMEWIDGTTLRAIVKDFAKRGAQIPLEFCARLVAQAALALGYAHRAAGLDGKLLKIIHRDVSPQNILLGTGGAVKLIDFGVAKATSASQQTAAGMIKGKFAYMSPEQLRGNPLDGRSDIYGLGLVLYELLAAERAVPGASEAEIAQNALTMNYPPIDQKRHDVPAPLKAILARALSRDRDLRYETAEAMAAELETFITPRMPKLSGADVAKLLPPTEPEVAAAAAVPSSKGSGSAPNPIAFWEHAPNAPTVFDPPREAKNATPDAATHRIDPQAPRPAIEAAPRAAGPVAPAFWTAPAPYKPVAKTIINPPGLTPRGLSPARRSTARYPAEPTQPNNDKLPSPSRLGWFIAATVIGFAIAALGWRLLRAPPPEDRVPAPVATVPPRPPPPIVEAPVPAAPTPEPAATARLTVTASLPTRITIDGKVAGKAPLDVAVPPGPHQLGFEDLGSTARQTRKIELKAGQTLAEEWKPERGRALIRAVPWAEVFLGGKSLGVTPIEPISLWAGKHTFTFVNSETQRTEEKTIEVKARADTLIKVDLRTEQ